MPEFPNEVEVLIVGAGPSGLALAAELRRLDTPALIIDKQAAGANTSRAAVIHARTLEVLELLGVTAELLNQGVKVPIFRIRDRDRTLMTIDFADIDSAYRFTLMCPQQRTEAILLAALEARGGRVERPAELTGVESDPRGIVATMAVGAQQRQIRCRWLVGCDGMHSRVRADAQIDFEGAAYEQSFVLADVRMDWASDRDEVNLFFSPDGLAVVAPLPGDIFRIVATADAAPEMPSLDYIQALLDARGPVVNPGRIREMTWSSRFRIHHRVASTPRNGRILLCGDAAHVHSPAGGQGMNTGIQDAISLAQVLAATSPDGDESHLDAWAARRHKIATDVVALTDRMTRMATMKSSFGQSLRNAALAFVGHLPPVKAALARDLAELDAR